MEAFVYCWTNKATNKLYVGSHKGSIDDGYICSSKYMLEEYNKRPDDFSRQIIAEGNLSDIRKLETKILQATNASVNEDFYNMHNNNGAYILKFHTEETKKKISQSEKGKKVSEESKNKMRFKKIGEKNNRFGTKHTDETKRKMSFAAKGRIFSENHRNNLSLAKQNRNWYHDPISKKSKLLTSDEIPEGWLKGRK